MTSNLGSDLIMRMTEEKAEPALINSQLEEVLSRHFKPEFLNRIDESIIFRALNQDDMIGIVEVQLRRLARRLEDKKLTVRFSQNAKKFLVSVGYNPLFGARPLKRAIQRHIEDQLARELLEGSFQEGDVILVDGDNSRIFFKKAKSEAQRLIDCYAPLAEHHQKHQRLKLNLSKNSDHRAVHHLPSELSSLPFFLNMFALAHFKRANAFFLKG